MGYQKFPFISIQIRESILRVFTVRPVVEIILADMHSVFFMAGLADDEEFFAHVTGIYIIHVR
jgi:hypothetical protein